MAPAPSSPSSRASACSGKTNPQQQQQQQQSSPTSILQQWRDDARGAMEDAYANYVLGDDAGESARLVLVATPAEDVLQEGGGLDDHRRKAAPHTRKQQTLTRHSHRHSSPISSPSLIMAVNSRKPCSSFHSCGVTFVEINGRAYVAGLTTDSAAYQAGVLPEDCVQYAAVLAKEWEAPLDDDFAAISHQALEREDKGQRITFGELKRVFLHGSGLLHNDAPHGVDMTMMGPNSSRTDVPTTIRIGKGPMTNPCGPSTLADTSFRRDDMDENDSDDDLLNPHHGKRRKKKPTPLSDDQPRPVVLVFRRTRQRPPRAWNFWPNYRLDDECDVACQILESLTTTTVFNGHARQHTSADDDDTNVEASAIRGMIQKAVGLAFVRSNKVVFGLSLAGGSGIVISKLSDGTWSAPSCIGMMGVGLGLQVGLEVANYIFILQTKEALEHFQRGGSFTLGANVGAAFAGMGREAVGAASVSSALCGMSSSVQAVKEDEYTFEDGGADGKPPGMKSSGVGRDGLMGGSVAPIVAYAKSEGLYVGVSLEGSRIFTREELNARAYKFSSYNHKAVSAQDILTGKIQQRPVEAENLYALLHSIEYTHEVSCLPALPRSKFLVDKSKRKEVEWSKPWDASSPPYIKNEDGEVASAIDDDDDDDDVDRVLMQDDIDDFNERFQEFLFGGVTVQRIAPHKREKRTLWLFAPQDHSLRLGFVSKLFSATSRTTHLSASIIQDISPKASNMGGNNSTVSDMEGDEVTLDSALMDNQSLLTTTGTLREKVELSKKLSVDVVDILSLSQNVPANIHLNDTSERRRVICIGSQDAQLVFMCRSIEETRLLFCGLKVLLEKETARLGIRGGQGKSKRGIPSALKNKKMSQKHYQISRKSSGYASSELDDTEDIMHPNSYPTIAADNLPEGWRSWGRLPGRAYMREQASSNQDGYPTYIHGQLLVRDVCKNVHLPLPLPVCRVLLLDSSSPVILKWEHDRGDSDFERTPWTFPPATPREMEQFQSEHQLIASGSMCGAHRTISYERYRNGQMVRLSETHIVDSDDSEKLCIQVTERLPRRGFSIKVKILLRAVENGGACEATVLGEIRPVGKNMSDPAAVHKAFLLVLDELRNRYGTDSFGLLSGFADVVEDMSKGDNRVGAKGRGSSSSRYSHNRGTSWEEKKDADPMDKTSVVKFEDVLNADRNLGVADVYDKFGNERRPSTPSPRDIAEGKYKPSRRSKSKQMPVEDSFESQNAEPVTIEVKPLPKIRLSLMPSPREEDEEDLDDEGEPKNSSKSPSSKSRSSKSSSRKVSWSKNKRTSKSRVHSSRD